MRLKDKVAIVTGGAQGIGQGCAIAFGAEGAQVAIWDINEKGAQGTAKQITDKGGKALVMKVDVTNWADVHDGVSQVVKQYGKLDILCACVGGGQFRPLIDYTPEFWEKEMTYNITTAFNCAHAVIAPMSQRKYGKIILFTSGLGYFGHEGLAGYAAAKSAVSSLGETLSKELAASLIRVNVIGPGLTDTPLTRNAFAAIGEAGEEIYKGMVAAMKYGRVGTPADIAKAAVFFASEESDWITGQKICVGGA